VTMKNKAATIITSIWLACGAYGCIAPVGAANLFIPKDAPQSCARQCKEVGMSLGPMVLMAGAVGCVCEPERSAVQSENSSASAAAGAATVMLQQQQQQRQRQQHRRSH